MSESKRCSKCGEVKGIEEFYLQRSKGPNARQSQCKTCLRVRTDAKRAACVPETEGTKQCETCLEVKPLTEFHIGKTSNDGRLSKCKICTRKRGREWKKSSPEKVKELAAKYREKHRDRIRIESRERAHRDYWDDPEKAREHNRTYANEWREANPERAKERERRRYYRDPSKVVAHVRKWRKDNPDRAKALSAKNGSDWIKANRERAREKVRQRRMIRREVGGSHTPEEWRALVDKFHGRCVCCGEYCGIEKLTRDHVIPLTKGGTDDISNLQCLCASCNCSKGNRHSADYRKTPFIHRAQLRLL